MDLEDIDFDAVETFIKAARRGAYNYCTASSGERAACKLARQASEVSGKMQDCDSQLKSGFVSLLFLLDWPDTRQRFLQQLP